MIWGKIHPDDPLALLCFALSYSINPHWPIDYLLRGIVNGKSLGGDPGWEIEKISISGKFFYRVWADSEITGISDDEKAFDLGTFNRSLFEVLMSFSEIFPAKRSEVLEFIREMNLEK